MKKKTKICIPVITFLLFNLFVITSAGKGLYREPKTILTPLEAGQIQYIYEKKINIRKKPSTTGTIKGTAVIGEKVKIIKKTDIQEELYNICSNWYYVECNGEKGYIWGGVISTHWEKTDFNRDGIDEILLIQQFKAGFNGGCYSRLYYKDGILADNPFPFPNKKFFTQSMTSTSNKSLSVINCDNFSPGIPIVKVNHTWEQEKIKKEIIQLFYWLDGKFENLLISCNFYTGHDYDKDVYIFPDNKKGKENNLVVENRVTRHEYDASQKIIGYIKNDELTGTAIYRWTGSKFVLEQKTEYTFPDIIDIADSGKIVLIKDGTVWAWGSFWVGDGSGMPRFVPVKIPGLSNVKAITSCGHRSLAIKKDGTLWEWGNSFKVTGNNIEYIINNRAVQVKDLVNVKAIGSGYLICPALKEDGTVWLYKVDPYLKIIKGYNPTRIENITKVKAAAGADNFIVMLKEDETVWIWGDIKKSNLNDSLNLENNTPVQVKGLSDVIAVNTGFDYFIALKKDGTVFEWEYGMPGPVSVKGLSNIKMIIASSGIRYALKNDGTVWKWNKDSIVRVKGLENIIDIGGGENYIIALKKDGSLWGIGSNENCQLGDGTFIDTSVPVQVIFK